MDGRVAKLKGFGGKTQEKILDGLRFLGEVGQRVRIDQGYPLGMILADRLAKVPGVIAGEHCAAAFAGGKRRRGQRRIFWPRPRTRSR